MIYFQVTEQFIKNDTHITQNVDAADIQPYIQIAAVTYLQPIMGYNFYNDILVKSDAGTLSTNEQTLVDFIKYMVAFYAAYEAVPNLAYRISNKGPQSQFGEYSASEGITVVEYIRRNIIKFAKLKEDELRAYLNENYKNFPLWKSSDNKDINLPNTNKTDNYGGITSI